MQYIYIQDNVSPVSWGCRIHRLHPCRGIRHPSLPNEYPDTKPFDGEAPAMEIWGIWNIPSLLLLSGPL